VLRPGHRNRGEYHDPAAPGWLVILRLLRPVEAVNAGLDSPPTPHLRRAMLDVIAVLMVRCAETGRTFCETAALHQTDLARNP
jgi:hypothetical protein